MKLLVEFRRLGTIAAVGEAMHYSPSGVSQQLALLEREVGEKLLLRTGRRVRLTQAGEVLCRHAVAVLAELERAEAAIAALQGNLCGTVRLAAFQTFNLAFLPALLGFFRDTDVRIEVMQLEPEASLPALREHRFDIVLAESFTSREIDLPLDLEAEWLLDERMFAAYATELVAPPASLADLAHESWVLEPRETVSRAWATATCRRAGFEPNVQFEAADLLTHLALVRAGSVAFVPELLLRIADVDGVGLLELTDEQRRLSLIRRTDAPDYPAVDAALRAIGDIARQPAPQIS